MAFNKAYYEERKQKLTQKFEINKDKLIQDMTRIFQEYYKEQGELQNDYRELEQIIKESKKGQKEIKKEIKKPK